MVRYSAIILVIILFTGGNILKNQMIILKEFFEQIVKQCKQEYPNEACGILAGKGVRVNELYIKDNSVNHPTLSFKDRVVAVAISKAKEFGFDTVACASTGNLANSVAAQAAASGLKAYIFIPADLESGKVIASLIYNLA